MSLSDLTRRHRRLAILRHLEKSTAYTSNASILTDVVNNLGRTVAEGCRRDIDELRDGMADADAWAQEYELKWLDEASAWLDFDLISSCEVPTAGRPARYGGGRCYVGVDIAARNDLFVIWVFEEVDGQLVTRDIITRKRVSFAEQDRLLDEVMTTYNVVRLAMDQTGMGEKPVEDARRRYGETRVEGVLFTTSAKLELAITFKEAFQDRRALIPAGDPALRSDLHSIKSRVGPTGIRRLVADGETDGHADRFWAGALAVSAANSVYQPMDYRPVRRASGDRDRPVKTTAGFGTRKGLW